MTGARKIRVESDDKDHVRLIKAIRRQYQWSQRRLAIELEVRRNTISRWENGESEPSAHSLKLIKALFPELTEKVMHPAVAIPPQNADDLEAS